MAEDGSRRRLVTRILLRFPFKETTETLTKRLYNNFLTAKNGSILTGCCRVKILGSMAHQGCSRCCCAFEDGLLPPVVWPNCCRHPWLRKNIYV